MMQAKTHAGTALARHTAALAAHRHRDNTTAAPHLQVSQQLVAAHRGRLLLLACRRCWQGARLAAPAAVGEQAHAHTWRSGGMEQGGKGGWVGGSSEHVEKRHRQKQPEVQPR